MAWSQIHWIPFASFILLPVTFLTTYLISVSDGNISPEYPYISDTGTHSPESCIFAELINIVAVLYLFTAYFRYKQIYHYLKENSLLHQGFIVFVNKLALFIGTVSCLGLSLVANFQETNLLQVHMTGAIACFGCGAVYCWLQTWLTYKTVPQLSTYCWVLFRLFLSVTMTVTFFVTFFLGPRAMKEFTGKDPRHWDSSQGGYKLHSVATISEWICAIAIDTFMGSFTLDLKKIILSSPKVTFIDSINILSMKQMSG